MALIYADLHIHGRYSRATSKNLSIASLETWAKVKGLTLLGTGDFTHPLWLKEIEDNLTEDGTGFLKPNNRNNKENKTSQVNFVLTTEVSNIYRQGDRTRKVHNILLAPDLATVKRINSHLSAKGKLASDGRPIFGGYSCEQMTKDLFSISERIEIIPAHIWTPWFSVLGDMSGFDSIEECFGSQAVRIHALETGLSSDPMMNARVGRLARYNLVSNSDSHSFWPWKLGREFNVLEIEENYDGLIAALRQHPNKRDSKKGLLYTVEVDPSFGKYHFTGHRNCGICLKPEESRKLKNICPKCKKQLTVGVLERVEELSGPNGSESKGGIGAVQPYKHLIPLSEIIAAYYSTGTSSKKVWAVYNKIIAEFGTELNLLLGSEDNANKGLNKIEVEQKLISAILDNMNGKLTVEPGYDGVYGKIILK